MRIHPVVTQANGIISVKLQASFVGDTNDAAYQTRIAAFGDPEINIAGTFVDDTDTNNPKFSFQMPTTEKYVGVTTELSADTVRFMSALPAGAPGYSNPIQGPLDVVTNDPGRALQVWYNTVVNRIQGAMTALLLKTMTPSLSDTTV
jgi:hypothetical protein